MPENPQLLANSQLIAPQRSATDGHECDSTPAIAPDIAPDEKDQCKISLRKITFALDYVDTSQNAAAIEGILAKTVRFGESILISL